MKRFQAVLENNSVTSVQPLFRNKRIPGCLKTAVFVKRGDLDSLPSVFSASRWENTKENGFYTKFRFRYKSTRVQKRFIVFSFEYMYDVINSKYNTLFIDITKVFDIVDRMIILNKLWLAYPMTFTQMV